MTTYTYRLATIKVADKNAIEAKTPVTIFKNLQENFNPIQEEVYILSFNNKMRLIEKVMVARGGLCSAIINVSDIFRILLGTNGTSFVIAHNHPSEEPSPSEDDVLFTKRLLSASEIMNIRLLDHIIFTSREFFSFRSEGLI